MFLFNLVSFALVIVSIFMILLVLVQRGRGGGLAGALGGMGGQSAFGAKAGDLFTRITVVVATIWILLCIFSIKLLNVENTSLFSSDQGGNAISTENVVTTPEGVDAVVVPEAPAGEIVPAAPATDAPEQE